MSTVVTLPVWLVVTLAGLALWAVYDHLLRPLLGWFVHQRVERALAEVNPRLQLKVQPFKLTRRQALVERLVFDSKVVAAAQASAAERQLSERAVMAEVRRYADEIVPSFNAWVYFRAGYGLARAVVRSLYRVRLGRDDQERDRVALADIDPLATVVFVVNHRSNVDYLLVSYLVAERAALSYAVGEWARIWPLESLIRGMGAFFVRRGSGNPLYRRVLERYVAIATAEGVTQAIFPEGGLSRDGRLRPPKLGLLDYLVRDFDPSGERDVVFVPVAVNYDRTLEDRTLLLDVDPQGAAKRERRPVWRTLSFIGRNSRLWLRNEWHRFGYACVSFGEPLSLRGFCAARAATERADPRRLDRAERFAFVGALADELMLRVGKAVPVLPVSLLATVLREAADQPLDLLALEARCHDLAERFTRSGARVYLPRRDRAYTLTVGLRMLLQRRIVVLEGGLYRVANGERLLLDYYANAVEHLLDPAAAVRPPEEAAS